EGSTIIVQAGAYGLYLGVLKLKIDPDICKVIGHTDTDELKKINAGKKSQYDKETANIVQTYYGRIQKEYRRVVGQTLVALVANRQRESNVGNLICDAMRKKTGTDIAVINSGAIRNNIPRGKITLEQVYTLLPFDDLLVTMKLTGRQILDILERNARLEHGTLQVSGMGIRCDLTDPEGSRVREVLIGKRPLNQEKIYTVTTIDYLASGGDAFSPFKEGKDITYGTALRDLIVSYLVRHSPVAPRIEGRIVMNGLLSNLEFHDKRVGFPRISLPNLETKLGGLLRLARKEYEPLGYFTGHYGPSFERPLFQVRSDLCLDICICHSL
ncbi:MAG TPA: 5'-nucleotidase, partial [Syntrophales bacterium]|nr:5'-nucleotidase [Syntrophales bacterium]